MTARHGPEAAAWRAERRADRQSLAWTRAEEDPHRGFRDAEKAGGTWAIGLSPDPRDESEEPRPRLHRVHRAPKGTNTRAIDLREANAQAERELREMGW